MIELTEEERQTILFSSGVARIHGYMTHAGHLAALLARDAEARGKVSEVLKRAGEAFRQADEETRTGLCCPFCCVISEEPKHTVDCPVPGLLADIDAELGEKP